MSKIEGLVGIASDKVNAFSKDILKLAGPTAQAPEKLAEAMFFITSAGLRGADALDVLTMSARAASANVGDVAIVADLVTSATNAYGISMLSAAQATDTLVATIREGKRPPEEIAAAIGRVLPVASEMGITFQDVGASIAAMSRTGTNAAEAVTGLRQILFGILKPAQQSEKAFKAMGTSGQKLREMLGKEDGLINLLDFLRENTTKTKNAFSEAFPNVRALAAALDVMGKNAEENKRIFARMKDNTGDLDKAFAAAAKTVDFKLKRAFAELKVEVIKIGQILIPTFLKIIEVVRKSVKWFNQLSTGTKQMGIAFAGLLAVAGPVVFIIGKMLALIVAVSSPIGLAVTAIILLTAAITGLGITTKGYNSNNFAEGVLKLKKSVSDLEKTLPPLIKEYEKLIINTDRSETENKKLDKVMQSIATIVPEAVTAWDEHGKALTINTTAAGKFLEMQKALLRLKNAEAIEQQTENLKRFEAGLESVTKKLNEGEQITVGLSTQSFKLTGDRLEDALKRQVNYNAKIEESKLLLAGLSGEYEKYGIILDTVTGDTDAIDTGTKKLSNTYKDLEEQIGDTADAEMFFADELERVINLMKGEGIQFMEAYGTAAIVAWQKIQDVINAPMVGASFQMDEEIADVAPNMDAILEKMARMQSVGTMMTSILSSAFSGLGNAVIAGIESGKGALTGFLNFFIQFAKGLLAKMITLIVTAVILAAALAAIGLGAVSGGGVEKGIKFGKSIANLLKGGLGLGGEAPKLRSGGFVTEGGVFQLHADELVNLPKGSAVTPANMVGSAGGRGTQTIHIKGELDGRTIRWVLDEEDRITGNTFGG